MFLICSSSQLHFTSYLVKVHHLLAALEDLDGQALGVDHVLRELEAGAADHRDERSGTEGGVDFIELQQQQKYELEVRILRTYYTHPHFFSPPSSHAR